MGSVTLELSLGIRRLEATDWNFSLGKFRLGISAWELRLNVFRFRSLGDFRIGSLRLETFACDLSLGTFAWEPSLGTLGVVSFAWILRVYLSLGPLA